MISVSRVDKDNYECYFEHGKCAIWSNNAYVGVVLLHDELYLHITMWKSVFCMNKRKESELMTRRSYGTVD